MSYWRIDEWSGLVWNGSTTRTEAPTEAPSDPSDHGMIWEANYAVGRRASSKVIRASSPEEEGLGIDVVDVGEPHSGDLKVAMCHKIEVPVIRQPSQEADAET